MTDPTILDLASELHVRLHRFGEEREAAGGLTIAERDILRLATAAIAVLVDLLEDDDEPEPRFDA